MFYVSISENAERLSFVTTVCLNTSSVVLYNKSSHNNRQLKGRRRCKANFSTTNIGFSFSDTSALKSRTISKTFLLLKKIMITII